MSPILQRLGSKTPGQSVCERYSERVIERAPARVSPRAGGVLYAIAQNAVTRVLSLEVCVRLGSAHHELMQLLPGDNRAEDFHM
jgi:hypothetical protein